MARNPVGIGAQFFSQTGLWRTTHLVSFCRRWSPPFFVLVSPNRCRGRWSMTLAVSCWLLAHRFCRCRCRCHGRLALPSSCFPSQLPCRTRESILLCLCGWYLWQCWWTTILLVVVLPRCFSYRASSSLLVCDWYCHRHRHRHRRRRRRCLPNLQHLRLSAMAFCSSIFLSISCLLAS